MEYASKGVAGTGLGLGIAGTALGVLNGNGNGNGLLGGLFGNNNNCNGLFAEVGQLKAEKYTDQRVIQSQRETFEEFRKEDAKLAAVLSKVTDGFLQVGNAVSRLDKEVECIKTSMAKDQEINALKLANVKSELSGAIALESERRACGDQNVYNYVNATFVPGKLVMPLASICPEAMPKCPDTATK